MNDIRKGWTWLRAGSLALALAVGGGLAAYAGEAPDEGGEGGEGGDAPAPALDWDALGGLLGGGAGGPAPAWQRKLGEISALFQATQELLDDPDRRADALANLAKAGELLADPDIPAMHQPQFTYVRGAMLQHLGEYEPAAQAFERLQELADNDGVAQMMGPDTPATLKGLAFLQLAELADVFRNEPAEALGHYERLLALDRAPSGLRSTALGRLFAMRMLREGLYDPAALASLARRQAVWSAFAPNPDGMPDALLPGHLAAADAVAGDKERAQALLDVLEAERGVDDPMAGPMAPGLVLAYAAMEDAAGVARWLAKELDNNAAFQGPREFTARLERLKRSRALKPVVANDAVAAVFADFEARAAKAVEEKRSPVSPREDAHFDGDGHDHGDDDVIDA